MGIHYPVLWEHLLDQAHPTRCVLMRARYLLSWDLYVGMLMTAAWSASGRTWCSHHRIWNISGDKEDFWGVAPRHCTPLLDTGFSFSMSHFPIWKRATKPFRVCAAGPSMLPIWRPPECRDRFCCRLTFAWILAWQIFVMKDAEGWSPSASTVPTYISCAIK